MVGDGGCGDGACAHDFLTTAPSAIPLSFVVEPRGGDASLRYTLSVAARDAGGRTLVTRVVASGFVAGRTILLRLRLDAACRGVGCPSADTCVAGACVSPTVDPGALPTVTPGTELEGLGDAGGGLDAPVVDAPIDDAPLPDGATPDSATPILASCSGLAAGAPSGTYRLDPDGPGSGAPFDAWCDNVAEGGGWTLIAKVVPDSTTLAYDAIAWTHPDGTGAAFGTPDESEDDALLLPYWRLPIDALRVVSSGGELIAMAVPTTVPRPLRAAMGRTPSIVLDATPADWRAVAPGTNGTLDCVRSGIDVSLPEGGPAEVAVRIGLVGSEPGDCSAPSAWFGVGARVALDPSRTDCRDSTASAGSGRLCGGPPGQRNAHPQFILVYGR